jgi:hypothetical protein
VWSVEVNGRFGEYVASIFMVEDNAEQKSSVKAGGKGFQTSTWKLRLGSNYRRMLQPSLPVKYIKIQSSGVPNHNNWSRGSAVGIATGNELDDGVLKLVKQYQYDLRGFESASEL